MSIAFLTAIAGLIFLWSIVSNRMQRLDISGPMVFVVLGLLLCNGPLHLIDLDVESVAVHELAEITLVLLLFADASRVDSASLRRDAGLPIRLLALGLPLTVAVGFGLAAALFTDLPWELAALLGAVLAPTDAALSASVVSNPLLPQRIRRSLNVESGLNDGIVTPAVTAFIAAAAAVVGTGAIEDTASGHGGAALVDLVGGVGIGIVVGYFGGLLTTAARGRGWIEPGGRRTAVFALPILAFAVSREVGVNYFVAAFVAGVAFRGALGHDDEEATELPELMGRVLALAVWFIFGGAMLLEGLRLLDWRIALYALASLTIVRMIPVAISMIGSHSDGPTTLFVGWFGPRGLASVVFGLLIVDELPAADPRVETVLATVTLTILLSVVAHGVSARPLSGWMARQSGDGEGGKAPDAQGPRPASWFGRR